MKLEGLEQFEYTEFDSDVHFLVLDQKYPFSKKFVQKVKTACLR